MSSIGISDLIAEFLLGSLRERDGILEISRGELAQRFGCVPSQINYVLTTRFSPEHGYIVETKRGGGGYVRITRVRLSGSPLIMHTVNAVGDRVDARSALALLSNLKREADAGLLNMIATSISDSALRPVPPEHRDAVRATILKSCLMELLRSVQ